MSNQETHSDGSIVFLAGCPGAGKTTAIADALTYELRERHPVVALDPTTDIARYLRERGVTDLAVVSTVAEARRARSLGSRVVLFHRLPGHPMREVCGAWLEYAAEHYARGDVLVCDEAEMVWPPGVARDQQLEVVKLARNRGVRLYVATQRPQAVATLLRSNATHVAVFGADSQAFIDPGCREFGDPALFERAWLLPKFHYLYRPRWRDDRTAPLDEFDARDEAAPWLEAE